MLLFVVGVLVALAGLIVSIALHEMGHLVPAKLFRVTVTQYMIGFGKTIFSRRHGETEYGVKWLPLGGYCAMVGMFPPEEGEGPGRDASTGFMQTMVQEGSATGRAGHGGQAAVAAVAAQGLATGRPASAAASPAAGGERHPFYLLAPWKRIIVMLGGPVMNLVIAVALFAIMFCGIGVQQYTTTVSAVSQCLKPATDTSQTCSAADLPSPAAAAGLRAGDRIESVDGVAVTGWDQLTRLIEARAGQSVPVVVARNGRDVTLSVTPEASQNYVTNAQGDIVTGASGKPETHTVGMIGISPSTALVRQSFGAALNATGQTVSGVVGVVVHLPQRLVGVWQAAFGPEKRAADSPVGMIGIGRMAGDIAASPVLPFVAKVQTMLSLLASLNVALFIFNLVPLLPLDGGHVAGALWDEARRGIAKLAGRRYPGPVDITRLMPLTMAVIVVLGGMSLLLAYADIVKPVTLLGG